MDPGPNQEKKNSSSPEYVAQDVQQDWRVLDTALGHVPDFVYVFDLEGRLTYVNRALLTLWQKSLPEVIGKNFFDLGYPEALADRLQMQIEQVIVTQKTVRDETAFTGPNHETRQYEYIFVPVVSVPAGKTTAVVGSTRDITERIQAQQGRAKSEERLTLALEAGGGIGTWDWDIASDLVYCDTRFLELFSLDPNYAGKGAPLAEFTKAIHSQDRAEVEETIRHATKSGGEYAAEFRVVKKDGAVRSVIARGRCHHDDAGRPTRFPGVVFDITERKRAQEELLESERQFRTLAESIPNLTWMAHADGSIFWYNRRWYEYTGSTLDEMQGWGWQKVHDPKTLPEVLEHWRHSIAVGEPFKMIFPLKGANGEFRSFLTLVEPLRDSEGKVARWFGTNTDVTSQRMIEEELRRRNRELEEFAYVASHDLQEPLRMVNIYTQLILKQCASQNNEAEKYGRFVTGGVARMEALLQDLLTYSRAVHDQPLAVDAANLTESLEEALSVLCTRIQEANATIIRQPLPTVRGDTDQMAHVFQNLISNSLKYRKKDTAPIIEITAEAQDNGWVISVRDNGIGFNPQYAERIFGLFKRLHKDEYEGTGLGLAICRRIVERCGGMIWGEGKLGVGAVFSFTAVSAE